MKSSIIPAFAEPDVPEQTKYLERTQIAFDEHTHGVHSAADAAAQILGLHSQTFGAGRASATQLGPIRLKGRLR
jgi:hypothetical protein